MTILAQERQEATDFVAELTNLFAQFEAAPESAKQEFLGLLGDFYVQLANSAVETLSGAVGGLQLRTVRIEKLRRDAAQIEGWPCAIQVQQ